MKKTPPSTFCSFHPRVFAAALLCLAGVALAFSAFHNVSAQTKAPEPQVRAQYRGLSPVVHFDVSPPLRDMQIIPPGPGQLRENEDRDIVPWKMKFGPKIDPVVQPSTIRGADIPGPIVSFDGPPNSSGVSPPDANGEVGPNHVVVMANLSFQIFNKTGTSLFGPALNNTLWAGFGGACQTSNSGDPVVLYDQLADRWLLSQFTAGSAPFLNCVAISTSPDPTGTYFRYAFQTGTTGANFPDYPKYGVWSTAYFISTREFLGTGGAFQGVGAYALNRAQMIAGNPNPQVISFLAPPTPAYNVGDGLLPADLDGTTLPPAGSPEYFVGSMDDNGPYAAPQDALTLWKFTVDFVTPANSSFVLANTIPMAPFNSILGLCAGGRACIPQPGTTNKIDHLGYRQRPLHRLAYRNFGDHESLVTNQSVSAGTGPSGEVSGIRWWELRSPNVMPVIYQQGTYAPGITDGIHRWMGSIAMDGQGNMAMGYSASDGTSTFPSLFYTGRAAGSALGTMPLGEGSIKNGTGSQTGSNRWGDYTAISVDPTDDLTFWYVNEYVPTTSSVGWQLRIGSFKLSTIPTNAIGTGGQAIVSAGPNGVLDPGEVVTVSLGLLNTGGPGTICTTSALTGTLQPGGGVTNPSGPQNYGAICSAGSPVLRNFSFTVDPALPCGSTVTASLAVTDGAVSYGTITYTFTTGSLATTNVESFDGVAAPALPAGWTTAFTGAGVPVVTSTTFPDTAPNDAFFVDMSTTGLSELTSPAIAISSAGNKLSFRNLYNTEPSWDGEVLEISINGGAFQDILAAGGTFASGGYTSTLNSSANPLTGRMAWNGLSGGSAAAPAYITTVVNLPPAAVGQSVQFKWRVGSDASVAPATNPGVRIDSITLVRTVCGGSAPTVTSAVSRKTHTGVGDFDIPLPLVPVTGAIGIEPRTGPVVDSHQIIVTFASPVTVNGAAVTTGTGTAAFSVSSNVVTVNLTGAANAQRLAVTLNGVNDGTNVGSVQIPIGLLRGDTNGDGLVNSGDATQTRARAGLVPAAGTFRSDVNTDGIINSGDTTVVRNQSGNSLP
ncbi:MAG: hypothetical protein M3Z22_06950 [Verrucomicrobiota bacterium]|nr:hypothetical protein [Verrucomicrobiota bacterium]